MARTFIFLAIISAAAAEIGEAQVLLFSPETAATAGVDPANAFAANEIVALALGAGLPPRHALRSSHISALMGDGDGDGFYNDGPTAIDALAVPPAAITGDVLGYILSFTTTVRFASGLSVVDGDVISLQANGAVNVLYPENFFAGVTGTSSIDVDAFHLEADGSLLFSFDADESTSLASLTAQNGGAPLIDESVVFRWTPGSLEATILLGKSQILAMVNAAVGTSLTTIVDTQGVSEDPAHPGEHLFTTASSQSAVKGKVFTTFGGGQVAQIAGQTLDAASLGLDQTVLLHDFAVAPALPQRIDLFPPAGIALQPGATASFSARGATPFAAVRLCGCATVLPAPQATWFGSLGAFGYMFLNTGDAFLYETMARAAFLSFADVSGTAVFSFSTANVPPGISVTMQAIDLAALSISLPVVIDT
jgi:hypothetical protein